VKLVKHSLLESVYQFWWLIVCSIIFMLLAYLLEHNKLYFLSHIARDIGIALLVSFFIILTIEHRQREDLSNQFSSFMSSTHDHILQSVLGVQFPDNVYQYVKEKIMKETFFRVDSNIVYVLSHSNSQKYGIESVNISVEASHTVCNLTNKMQVYPIKVFVERDPATLNEDLRLERSGACIEIDGDVLKEDQLIKADASWSDTPEFVRFQYDVELPAGGQRRTKFSYTRQKLIRDTEVWRSVYPSNGVYFTIKFPDDMEVFVDAMHSDDLEYRHRSAGIIICRITRPLLPHNGFMFWWSPKPVLTTAVDDPGPLVAS